jgi:hypothetical protein
MWPVCRRPEGAVGTYSPWCRGHWPYNIAWPLCSLWWGDNWPHGAPGTDPHQKSVSCVLECARSRAGARSTTWEFGTLYVSITYQPLANRTCVLIGAITRGLVCSFWRVWGSIPLCNQGRTCNPVPRFSKEEEDVVIISWRK